MHSVNATFNNAVFSCNTIPTMHASMEKLYRSAATKLGRELGQTELARELGKSPQVVKNWESRGISKQGALLAQSKFGCDANQLRGDAIDANYAKNHGLPPTRAHEPQPWDWPFASISPSEWATLRANEKLHVEAGIKMLVRARDDPSKQEKPASYTIATGTA